MGDTIAEIIIPTTDTPGASVANVNRFIDALVGESYLPKGRDRFLSGLDDINVRCEETFGADAPYEETGRTWSGAAS